MKERDMKSALDNDKVRVKGKKFDVKLVIPLMDDEIRESLHSRKDWESEQQFLDQYCIEHQLKFLEEFIIN